METEIEPLNSPEKNDLNDTNYNHDYSLSEEFGVKRTFTEIINEVNPSF